jgi:addiction module HigA family antidote
MITRRNGVKTMRREPTGPGEILAKEFIEPLGLTQKELKVINRIVNGRAAITAGMAVRFASAFGTTPEFWMNAQQAVDLHRAVKRAPFLPKRIGRAG